MGSLLAVVIIAYSYSLTTLLQLADLNTPLAYVSLVPLVSLILAAVNSRPTRPEPAIHDRQTDYIIGIPLMVGALCVNLFLPSKLSAMFWVWRIDLLTLPFFVAGAVAVIFGVRVLWRQKVAVAFLFLAWPYPYTSVLLGVLNAFTSATLFAIDKIVRVVHVATPIGGVDNTVFTVVHDGHPFNLSVISACSGVSSVVGFLLVGAAFTAIIRGPLVRKLLWLAGGMLLLWVINLGRLTLVFWAGQRFGEHFAIDVLHPYIGLVLFTLGVGVMILCIRPLGLRIGHDGGRPTRRETLNRMRRPRTSDGYAGTTCRFPRSTWRCHSCWCSQSSSASATSACRPTTWWRTYPGSPKVISYINDPVTPVGWTSRYQTTFKWAAPLFGESSVWNRYELYPGVGGDLQAQTDIVADVIDTSGSPDLCGLRRGTVLPVPRLLAGECDPGQFAGGITGQALAYTSQQYGSWTIVYWILPVKRGAEHRLRASRALRAESARGRCTGHARTNRRGSGARPASKGRTTPSRLSFSRTKISWWPTLER